MNHSRRLRISAVVAATGIVYGDIGTSPLYTLETALGAAGPFNREAVLGVLSLIFWSLMISVTIKYIVIIMQADNEGEGGIMALITLIRRGGVAGGRRTKLALALLGVFGASLFFGDSMITPAISVLSAIEGVKVAAPSVSHLIVPITA